MSDDITAQTPRTTFVLSCTFTIAHVIETHRDAATKMQHGGLIEQRHRAAERRASTVAATAYHELTATLREILFGRSNPHINSVIAFESKHVHLQRHSNALDIRITCTLPGLALPNNGGRIDHPEDLRAHVMRHFDKGANHVIPYHSERRGEYTMYHMAYLSWDSPVRVFSLGCIGAAVAHDNDASVAAVVEDEQVVVAH